MGTPEHQDFKDGAGVKILIGNAYRTDPERRPQG